MILIILMCVFNDDEYITHIHASMHYLHHFEHLLVHTTEGSNVGPRMEAPQKSVCLHHCTHM